jgi:hypothetical protein
MREIVNHAGANATRLDSPFAMVFGPVQTPPWSPMTFDVPNEIVYDTH